jgi:toxin ParE1/3/4
MPQVLYTPEADQDLRKIATYIARDNLAAALHWLDEMQAACDLLAAQPGIGQRMHTRRFGEVRRHVVGNYLIYYQPAPGCIEILRVLHGAREQERLI